MTASEAYAIFRSKTNNRAASKCFEHNSIFVFHAESKSNVGKALENLYSVSKNNGEVKLFIPTMISPKEYHSGKEVTDLVFDDELQHHGVKGMKWGVRKQDNKGYPHKKRVSKREKLRRSVNRGRKQVKKWTKKKYSKVILNTAAIISGAALVTSAAITATPASAISTVGWVTGHVAGILNRSLADDDD